MVPLRATEGAADMPSPSCGAVIYLCGYVFMWGMRRDIMQSDTHGFKQTGVSAFSFTDRRRGNFAITDRTSLRSADDTNI